MEHPIVAVRNLRVRFGTTTVIDDLSFEVHRGEVFGFLGSNGSGKTTTIRALLGIYRPDAGSVLINGVPFSPEAGARLGYLPEERGLYKKEKVLDTMVYFGQLKGLAPADARSWSLKYLERVELSDKAGLELGKLSGGQQQKVQLGVTIMNEPDLLILDEPTKGFDPVNRRLMMEIIEERRAGGATIILVTHQMEEAERLCDRVLLLKNGSRRLYGTVDEVRALQGSDRIMVAYSGTLAPVPQAYAIAAQSAGSAELVPAPGATARQVLEALVAQPELAIAGFRVDRPSLDDVFISIYGESAGASHA